jgi:nucleoside-diphosphate-sugar epimerase
MESRQDDLSLTFSGASVLIAGAAGSIGTATVAQVLRLNPSSVVLLDQSENGLAELVRELRSTDQVGSSTRLQTVLADIASPLVKHVAGLMGPFDVVMNLAAAKHVRSERDSLSALRLLEVNVLGTISLMNLLVSADHTARFFSVSTDKAAGPVSLMGASKRLMERAMFQDASIHGVTSCRFANVAFSAGSLPDSWLRRIASHQPVAVPRGIRRYFVSAEEAGQFCVLSAAGESGSIYFPTLRAEDQLVSLESLLADVLDRLGLVPEYYADEREALADSARMRATGRQPVLITDPDTAGEKPIEEFVAEDERSGSTGMPYIDRVVATAPPDPQVTRAIQTIERFVRSSDHAPSVADIIGFVQPAVPTYVPAMSERSLDERL